MKWPMKFSKQFNDKQFHQPRKKTQLTGIEIKEITDYIQSICGICLDESKAYLLETRLQPLLKKAQYSSISELCQKAKQDRTKKLEEAIIDAISTQETFFFRDALPFQLLQHKIIPDLIDIRAAKSSRFFPININIWSAGCSTGQEVYSIAMVIKELLPDLGKYRIQILGTDISQKAIAQALRGDYNQFEIGRGLPAFFFKKFFLQNGGLWQISTAIHSMVTFQQMNLLLPFPKIGPFDIVFCRNVAIYFNFADKVKVFEKISQVMAEDGYLIIGSSESLTNFSDRFEPRRYLKSVFYQLKKENAV
jgi:chemotaxis protein methyltransferase CheR